MNEPSLTSRRTILFVDDDALMRRVVRRQLAVTGWTLLEAADASSALLLAASLTTPLDALFTDVVLAGIDGCVLAARVRAIHPETRVLYTSGYGVEILEKHGVTDAARSFLSKPFEAHALRARLAELFADVPDAQPPNEGSLRSA